MINNTIAIHNNIERSLIKKGFSNLYKEKELYKAVDDSIYMLKQDAENMNIVHPIIYMIYYNINHNKYNVFIDTNEHHLGFPSHIYDYGYYNNILQNSIDVQLDKMKMTKYIDSYNVIGTIYTPDVNINHLGYVTMVKYKKKKHISIYESKCTLMNTEDMANNYFKFDNWSKHMINHLIEGE